MSADPGFVHLHVHSAYSLLEGALPVGRLADLAKADKQPALALTDTDNMFGALEFSEKMAASGIQPIVGCALAIDFGDETRDPRQPGRVRPPSRIVLLAATEEGYGSLIRLNSRAFLETSAQEAPHVKLEWLEGHTAGLIALTGGPDGPIDQALAAERLPLAKARCEALHRLFGDRLYVELQRHGTTRERFVEPGLLDIAYTLGIPLVATNEPYFARRDDHDAHDGLICIAEGRAVAETDRRQLTPRALLQEPQRDGRAVCGPAGGAGLDGGDRAALRIPAADATSRSCRASPWAMKTRPPMRRPRCACAPRRGWRAGWPPMDGRPAAPRRSTASASPSS